MWSFILSYLFVLLTGGMLLCGRDGDKILPAEVLESVGKAKEAVAGASGALEGAAAVVRDTSVKAKDLYEKAPKTESGALKIDVPKVDLPKVNK